MNLFRRLRALAAVLAVAAIVASTVAVSTTSARPKDCPYCCMDIPFPPYYVCFHCCP